MICRNGIKEYSLMAILCFAMWFIFSLVFIGMGVGIRGFAVAMALLSAVLFSGLFTGAMAVVNIAIENKYSGIRQRGANYGIIICEGVATIKGNGGWMFLTENGFEFYPHKFNFNSQNIIIPIRGIIRMNRGFNNITLTTQSGIFKIVVAKSDVWVNCVNSLFAKQ